MQIVIDIPDGAYEELCNAKFPIQDAYRLVAWIKDGTPLPKGHGDLKDVDEIERIWKKGNAVRSALLFAPTVIEADKGDENG